MPALSSRAFATWVIRYARPSRTVIDNAITANAREIKILADTHVDRPAIGVLDNGVGMTRGELLEAMRPGTRNPLESRHQTDLGRFGLGLKTALVLAVPATNGADPTPGQNFLRTMGSGYRRRD